MLSPLELTQRLIQFDTTNPPGNERQCVEFIDDLLTEAGIETVLLARDEHRPNLIARLKGRGDAPPLLFQGHVDVVTTLGQNWSVPPFQGVIKNGFLWGRGTLDMKGAVAMMVWSIIEAKLQGVEPAGDIILCVLADEENSGNWGAKYLVDNHPEQFEGVKYAISEFGGTNVQMAGQTFYPIQIAEKRSLKLTAKLTGQAGHGSGIHRNTAMGRTGRLLDQLDRLEMPLHVVPAVREMLGAIADNLDFPAGFLINRLLNPATAKTALRVMGDRAATIEPLLKHTINATIINGGIKRNVIPSEIDLEFDVRMLPGFTPEEFLAELKGQLDTDAEFIIEGVDPIMPAKPNMGLFPLLSDLIKDKKPDGTVIPFVLPAVTDARFFASLGIQTYGFTPMELPQNLDIGTLVHGPDERIPVDAPEYGARMMLELIKRYSG
ncbi:MAG: M20/M25/M40 family metallo-hydrolase [Chloroflexota bacterium]